jgi:hypothetical protein
MLRETLFSDLAKWTLDFVKAKPGDEVLVCVSPDTDTSRYSSLVTYCRAIGAVPHVLVVNTPPEAIGLWSLGRGVRLPKTVAAALKATDFIYWFCDWDPAFLQEIRDARKAGAMFLFGWPGNVTEATWHLRDADIPALTEKAHRWAETLNKLEGKEFRLITGGEELVGTTHRFFGSAPGVGKASWTQNECMSAAFHSDANGVQNVDWMGVCSEILPGETGRFTVKDGILASAEGELGEMLWKILKARNEPNLYKMAELAVGLNPYTRVGVTALGAPNIPATIPPYHEVKMSEGTIHTAWGDSGGRFSTPGDVGTIATLHIDTVSFRPTLIIDGKTFVEDGKLLI